MTFEEPRASEKAMEEPIEDDDLYCLQSTFVYFQVEKRIFHVPTYRFVVESLFFKGMFNLPQANVGNSNAEGSSRDNPISLPDNISRNDFRNFLKWCFLSSCVVRRRMDVGSEAFHLLVLPEISENGDIRVERSRLRRRLCMEGHSIELAARNATISKEEAIAIDYETTFALFRIRENHQRQSRSRFFSFATAIEDVFKEELDVIKHFETEYEEVEVDIELESTEMARKPAENSY